MPSCTWWSANLGQKGLEDRLLVQPPMALVVVGGVLFKYNSCCMPCSVVL